MNPDVKLRIANQIAMLRGFVPRAVMRVDSVQSESDEDTCDTCESLITDRCYATKSSYEYDEWTFHCSLACASGITDIGGRAFFLETMGWTLWHEQNCGEEFRWAKHANVGDYESVLIAHEGDATWDADLLVVGEMMAEFEKLIEAAPPATPHDQFWNLRRLMTPVT